MELETKHLAPYLAWNLAVEAKTKKGRRFDNATLTGINFHKAYVFQDYMVNLEDLKPILRPLSQLTETITDNGKTFIPLVELALKVNDNIWSVDMSGIRYNGGLWCKSIYGDRFGYLLKDCSFAYINNANETRIPPFQFQLFQLLFEWHFDVFGLIDKGLAIAKSN